MEHNENSTLPGETGHSSNAEGGMHTVIRESTYENALQPGDSTNPRPELVMLQGSHVNQKFPVDKKEIVIGRDLGADIVLKDPRSSRRHARIVFSNIEKPSEPPVCRLFDQGSANGTLVNDVAVPPEGTQLDDKDKLQIGHTIFGYFITSPEQPSLEKKLVELACNDHLTGLFNRATFMRVLEREVSRARRYERNVTMLFIEIDRIHHLTETHGPHCTDTIMREIGTRIEKFLRIQDILARYGESRLAAVLPETPFEEGEKVARRVCQLISSEPIRHGTSDLPVTVSIGVAHLDWDVDADGLNHFTDMVEKALQSAMLKGGNCAVAFQNP
jgi:two-component system cell cycle response regulator